MHEPDPHVVRSARRGDLAAFEELVRDYQADVWRLCFHLLHDETLADDVTQDTFLRIYRFLEGYRLDAKFSTWALSIARNCALDELRRLGRRRKLSERIERQPAHPPSDVGDALEVREALASLPVQLREPIVLIDMFGTSYREVARIVGAPVGTVKSRVHRARELLAQKLSPQPEEDTGEG